MVTGEDATDAAVKSARHLGAGLIGAQIGTMLGPGLGTAGSMLFDLYYDNKDKIAAKIQDVTDNVVDSVKDTTKKIGDAVSDFFGNLGSVFG